MKYKILIENNTARINRLHDRIHESWERKQRDPALRDDWKEACRQFHAEYPLLYFLDTGMDYRQAVRSGHQDAIDYALDFLELRPRFFRSGYMYTKLMRILNNCPLSSSQRRRYSILKEQYMAYKKTRRESDQVARHDTFDTSES